MDKNTIYGLLLMALVFVGFMWLNPAKNDTTARENLARAEQAEAAAPEVTPLSAQEIGWLRSNIKDYGKTAVSADSVRTVRLQQNGVDLMLRGDSVSGTVNVGGRTVSFADVLSANPAQLSAAEHQQAIETLRTLINELGRYGKFSAFLSGADTVVKLENEVLALQFSSKSGSVTRAELKKYDTEYSADETKKTKRPVVLFEGDKNKLDFAIPLPQPISSSELYFRPSVPNDSTVLMTLDLGENAYWGIRYTLPKGDSYVVKIDIVQKGAAPIVQSNNRTLSVDWTQTMARQEMGRTFEERNSGLFYKFAGGSVENLNENKNDKEERKAKVKWIGFKNQFFSSVLIAHSNFNTADFQSEVLYNSDYLKKLSTQATVSDYDWNAATPASFSLFLGPNLYPLLSDLDKQIDAGEDLKLTRLIPLGWNIFRWINTLIIIPIFTFLGSWISNYGIIILLLTIFIKLILFPLTYKSYKSQAKMRILAPDIKEINDKYPGTENAMKRQQKTMELYQRAGASPMSGCLPLLLQMPILFAMFSFFPSCIELRGQSFLWAHDLSAPDAIISWSGNIPLVTKYFGNHISLFCLLMTATNILYTWINMKSQPSQMPGMKWMMYLMPVFFMVFFNNYAAGLSYYYFLSLLITIIQTYAVRRIVSEDSVRRTMAENAKKPKKKSGFMARMEEMQRQQQQMLKEQQKKANNAKGRR